ncbi:extensin-like domain-containing protein [Parasphingopyxis marina]|uniref:Extensin family protein n=1 Tax=Parasphingopyxis marina TaxID=2761622 RepID=A0A842HZS0_9SPHN|nr:extensin family protein [Parasphingopyxis marina]MBC2778696.1 extensin family protein [Parasphingopyxis marina]
MRIGGTILLCLLLASCGLVDGRSDNRPAPQQRTERLPAPSADLRQCLGNLSRDGVEYTRLPDRNFSRGCRAIGAVQLLQVGVPTRNLGAMTCPLAARYGRWVREVLQPAAQRRFGEQVTLVETFGTYSCRNINGSGRLSEHGKANAIDISAFTLAGGRRITVQEGWRGDRREREFLRELHSGACERFEIVLGPDANADHYNHFHFDMGDRGPYCR